jgi:hypothetical protein
VNGQTAQIIAVAAVAMVAFVTPLRAEEPTEPAAEGQWIQLFNGHDLSGWTPKIKGYDVGDNYADTFRVEDGLLRVSYDKYEGPFGDRFAHLYYNRPFSHYILRIEYRFTGEQYEGGPEWGRLNSGVMLHGQSPQSMRKDQDWPISIEAQFLGSAGNLQRPTANVCTPGTSIMLGGKFQPSHCTESTSRPYDADEWVTVEIEVHGGRLIRHKIDGQTVLEYSEPQFDLGDQDARRLHDAGADKLLTSGTIALQSESHPIEFRKVELRELAE